jgi:erythritol kinase (D-erythritol 1-phosphate-forming)
MSVLGLDLGTSRVKAVRFADDWRIEDIHAETTSVHRPRPGQAEQDMDLVWQAACRALRAVGRDDVSLVAVTAQGDGCWLVDRNGDPVRPALLWNDNRAAPIIDAWEADGTLDVAFRRTGCDGSPGLAHAQLRWLANYEPRSLDRAATLLSCGSWVHHRLTGELVQHVSDLHNPFLDAVTGRTDADLLARYGLQGYADLLPPAVDGADSAHPLRAAAATDLGLVPGTPVVLAPYDVVSSAIGVGAVRPDDAAGILGTTMCATAASDDPQLSRPRAGMSLPMGIAHRWLIAYATLAGTEVLDWMADLLSLSGGAALIDLAGRSRSADVPLLLPYLSPAGERAPFRDSTSRGAFGGLSLHHRREDVARAAVDGVTLALRDCLQATTGTTDQLSLCGGGARNPQWCQTVSDATGRTVAAPDTPETGARGAALAGSVALGRYATLEEACRAAIRPRALYRPDPDRQQYFTEAYDRLLRARDAGATHL